MSSQNSIQPCKYSGKSFIVKDSKQYPSPEYIWLNSSSWQNTDGPATFQNDVTHWWDASQLYGSDEQTSAKLRSFKDGKMKVSPKNGLLPLDKKTGIEITGEFVNLNINETQFSPSGIWRLFKLFIKIMYSSTIDTN